MRPIKKSKKPAAMGGPRRSIRHRLVDSHAYEIVKVPRRKSPRSA